MKNIVARFLLLMLLGCSDGGKEMGSVNHNESNEVDFIRLNKDSASVIKYRFSYHHENVQKFDYYNDKGSFSLLYDSLQNKWTYISKGDTSHLELEDEEVLTINSADFRVYKLIRDKGIADGELTYFVHRGLGILIVKSNTWRSALFFKSSDPVISALVFKIISDSKFYTNQPVSSEIEFVHPTVK